MKKFVPYEKLSKRKKREMNKKKRSDWGTINPITRKSKSAKAYSRKNPDRDQDFYFPHDGFRVYIACNLAYPIRLV